MNIFGSTLKQIRTDRGYTLEQMADLLKTTKQALSRYENGKRTPKITVAADFAEKLGVPLESLMGNEVNEQEPSPAQGPQTEEARILAKGIDQLNPEQRAQALAVVKAMFAQHPEIFD